MIDRADEQEFCTVADVLRFGNSLNEAAGSPEDLAGVLMKEVAGLNALQLESLKTRCPQYSKALDQAANMGKAQGEISVRARTLSTLLREDDPSIDLSALVTHVRNTKIQQ